MCPLGAHLRSHKQPDTYLYWPVQVQVRVQTERFLYVFSIVKQLCNVSVDSPLWFAFKLMQVANIDLSEMVSIISAVLTDCAHNQGY